MTDNADKMVDVVIVCGLGEPFRMRLASKVVDAEDFEMARLNERGRVETRKFVRSPDEDQNGIRAFREFGRGAQA